jgi:CMP-2-keto-3-deoxyoctulosonic acid synthetase
LPILTEHQIEQIEQQLREAQADIATLIMRGRKANWNLILETDRMVQAIERALKYARV